MIKMVSPGTYRDAASCRDCINLGDPNLINFVKEGDIRTNDTK